MAIFLYPFTERKSYSIVTLFEPNDFLSEPWSRITLHTGGQILRNYEQSNLERNAYAKRQIKKKRRKNVWSHSTKSRNVQRKEKCWEVQKEKKSSKEKIWKRIKIKIKKILHMARNDPWSDHPKTRFWAYLSSSCINPNLAYITYFESPFGSNAGTWAKEFLP